MQNLDPKLYGLALHTTTPQLGLAIANFSGNTRAVTWDLGRDLSTHLHQQLAEFLKPQTWADLAFIAVAKGPGGFTGTRIGVVTARTLAQQLNIPLFGVSTLAAVAWSHLRQLSTPPAPLGKEGVQDSEFVFREKGKSEGTGEQDFKAPVPSGEEFRVRAFNSDVLSITEPRVIAVQMPAQRGQLFAGIYQLSPSNLRLTTLFPDTVLTTEDWQKTLDNWQNPYDLIEIPAGGGLGGSVSSVIELAYLDWQQGKRYHWSEVLPFYGQHPVEGKS
ncbi:MAG TPA: tRNA (adenosine(37)-N6)-threonylcarbamoyltransferase complex dimerization subunit type 1 TsaB [Cyanophyceae cyanobacterium]